MKNILSNKAVIPNATKETLVNQYLKQLSLDIQNLQAQDFGATEEEQILNLALQVLVEGDFQQRWEVTKLLPKLGKKAIAPLLKILEDEEADLETRWFVGRILGEFDDPQITIALTHLLQTTQEEELSRMAAATLANMGVSAIEALSQLLTNPSLRLPIVNALAQIRHSQTILPLLTVIDDPLPEVRATAIEALGSFHDEHLITFLVKALKDPASMVRKQAVIALGMQDQFKDKFDLVSQIKPLLYDMDEEVCQQAVLALGRMGDNQAAQALSILLKSPATPIILKQEAVRVLGWLGTTQALTFLKEGLRWGDPIVCQAIVIALGQQKSPPLTYQATQILIDFLYSGQEASKKAPIKQALAMSLGELQQPAAIQLLQGLAADLDQGVRLHAIAALRKFSPEE